MLVIMGIWGWEMWWLCVGSIYLSDNQGTWLRRGVEYRFPSLPWILPSTCPWATRMPGPGFSDAIRPSVFRWRSNRLPACQRSWCRYDRVIRGAGCYPFLGGLWRNASPVTYTLLFDSHLHYAVHYAGRERALCQSHVEYTTLTPPSAIIIFSLGVACAMWGQRCEEPLIAGPSAPLNYRPGAFGPPGAPFLSGGGRWL